MKIEVSLSRFQELYEEMLIEEIICIGNRIYARTSNEGETYHALGAKQGFSRYIVYAVLT